MHARLKTIRQAVKLNQEDFGKKINLSRSHIASLESGARALTDRIIFDVCREFSVDENWLRTGEGNMFLESTTFSLDEYAKQKGMTPLETGIIKDFMDFDPQERKDMLEFFKKMFDKK